MKKLYFAAALIAIGLASCTNEEEVHTAPAQKEIAFKTVAGKSTRSAAGGVLFSTATPIYVTAIHKAEGASKWEPFYSSDANKWIEYVAPSGKWVSNITYYYPKNGVMEFFAYSCDENTDQVKPFSTSVETDDTYGDLTKITLEFKEDDTKETKALNGNTEVMYAYTTNVDNFTDPTALPESQPLQFKHTLAWVEVNLSGKVASDAGEMKINKVTIDKVNLNGKLTIDIDDHAVEKIKWDATDTKTDRKYDFYCPNIATTIAVLNTNKTADHDKGLLLIPQPQTSITIQYTSTATGQLYTHKIPLNLPETDPAYDENNLAQWEAGKHYVYSIVFGLAGIQFTCSIADTDKYQNVYDPNTGQVINP